MVAALASRELGRPVNRKRVQRVMRAQRLLQPTRSGERRRRPGFFRVTRPDALWHADMTKVWTAQHGWVYLHAIIDCCTRELVGWSLELRCRDDEAIACVEAAVMDRGVRPGQLTLGTDNGSQFTPATSAATCRPAASPPAGRLPRSRVASIHRVLVRTVQETPGVAVGVGVAGPGEKGDQRLRRRLPASAPFEAGLPHPSRGRHDLAARPRHATNPSDLTRQRRRGPRHEIRAAAFRTATDQAAAEHRPRPQPRTCIVGATDAAPDIIATGREKTSLQENA